MSDKIKQCERDIAKLQEELARLKEEETKGLLWVTGTTVVFKATPRVVAFVNTHKGDYIFLKRDSYNEGEIACTYVGPLSDYMEDYGYTKIG